MADGTSTAASAAQAWAASGAMALTGRRDGPALGPPAGLVPCVEALGARITAASAAVGRPVAVDWLALLGERAALAGLQRDGATSCGGATRLLPAADGWLAVALARPDDVELLPAWLGTVPVAGDLDESRWAAVAAAVAERSLEALVERATLLGLPVGAVGERAAVGDDGVERTRLGAAPAAVPGPSCTVVDLSSLWAGPLCASLLGAAGARVLKVESTGRPDAAREGCPPHFDLLNAGKQSVALDLRDPAGRRDLTRLLCAADVVVESSRPRALEQLGLVAADLVAGEGPQVWVSITGHGRRSGRVAFGDDAAVAGGLVVADAEGPCFCADAVADPITGLAAAATALELLAEGGRWIVDAAMAAVSATAAGPTLAAAAPAVPPRARPPAGPARPFGADTAAVLAAL